SVVSASRLSGEAPQISKREFLLGSEPVAAGAPHGSGPARILVVDDEPSARKLLSIMFCPPTFECISAGCSEEALVALQRERFDVIISDLCMPGIGGLALISEARRKYPYIAFLVTTGVDDVEVGVRAMKSGADDYLVKPLVETAVVASVERAVHKQQLERQVDEYRGRLEEMVAERTAQLREALQRTEESYQSTIEALGAAIDLRDKETAGHSQRVCRYTLQMGRTMNLSDAQMENLARGAYLHDIGKLAVPDRILLKPGPLTSDEWQLMKQHARIGFDLVRGIPFLEGAAEIVLTHHENFDGSGYPQGLRAQEIPLGGRIFAIADTLDAMTSDRPYHRAAPFDVAQDAIRREAGRRFDPEIVAAFLSFPVESWKEAAGGQSSRDAGERES
ncbi:MAG: HD domain-containing phosphohydrolase, partial [Terracidiphilus sp.]